jgi:hypothetical protein
VRANDATKVYGDANPSFHGHGHRIKNGDAITASYARRLTAATGVARRRHGGGDATPAVLANYRTPA